jgi:LysM repeat protein
MRKTHWLLVICLLLVTAVTQAQESTAEPESTPAVEVTPEATENAESTPEASEPAAEGGIYVVQRGDNLFRIALRNGLSTQALAEANGITNPALIYVGQRLIIPGVTQPAAPTEQAPASTPTPEATEEPVDDSEAATYTVKPGDTLFRIALRNATTVRQLVELNAIKNPNLIFVGQILRLPSSDGAAQPAVESTPEAEATAEATEAVTTLNTTFTTGIEVFLGQDIAALTAQVTSLNVQWVKIVANWRDIEPAQGEFNFASLDDAVDSFDAANLSIMLTLIGSPDWARPSATEYARSLTIFHAPPDDLNSFGAFAGTVAQRYAGRVDSYEIWSEPNIRRNWLNPAARMIEVDRGGEKVQEPTDAGLAPVRYIDLLEAAYRAIKASDPAAIVLSAGLAPTGFNDYYNAIDSFIFFEELLKQGALNFSDAVSIHLDGFSNAPDATCCGTADSEPTFDESYHFFFGVSLSNYREILARNGGEAVPLWITRFGWGTAENALSAPEPGTQDYLANNTAAQQAAYTMAAFTQAKDSGYVASAILYNLNGCTAGGVEACFYSLIDVTGNARPLLGEVQSAGN